MPLFRVAFFVNSYPVISIEQGLYCALGRKRNLIQPAFNKG